MSLVNGLLALVADPTGAPTAAPLPAAARRDTITMIAMRTDAKLRAGPVVDRRLAMVASSLL
jgi:hypothetical protein